MPNDRGALVLLAEAQAKKVFTLLVPGGAGDEAGGEWRQAHTWKPQRCTLPAWKALLNPVPASGAAASPASLGWAGRGLGLHIFPMGIPISGGSPETNT